jgi:hypothetical protein
MTMSILLVGLMAFLTIGGYFVLRTRPSLDEAFHYFRCPRCGQKLRYQAYKAGRRVMCPGCKERWKLPAVPGSGPATPADTPEAVQSPGKASTTRRAVGARQLHRT